MRSKNKARKIGILLLIVSISLISSGVYIGYISNPKRIALTAMRSLSASIYTKKETPKENVISTLSKETSFTINSSIKLTASSPYIVNKVTTDEKYLKYANLIKNINSTENNISYIQDNKNKKLLVNIDSTLYNEPLFIGKYLIQDATTYYYINNFKDAYINNGNNNYFETITTKTTTENIKYLLDFIKSSFKSNLKNDYFEITEKEMVIGNEKDTYNQITLTIDNDKAKKIINSILKDLKNDKESSKILTSINKNFNNYKITKKTQILKENTNIVFNIYTDKMTYQIRKQEIILKNTDTKITISYDYNKRGEVLLNDEVIYYYHIDKNSDGSRINILSKEEKNIGSIIYNNVNNLKVLEFNYSDLKHTISANYKVETSTIEKDKKYSIVNQFNLRITNNETELINANYLIDTIIENKAKIEEDISTSIFQSSITEEEKLLLQQNNQNNYNKLYS